MLGQAEDGPGVREREGTIREVADCRSILAALGKSEP